MSQVSSVSLSRWVVTTTTTSYSVTECRVGVEARASGEIEVAKIGDDEQSREQ